MGDTLVVYIDVLLFVNAVINSTLLYITYKILNVKPSPIRFISAVCIATAYGLVVCFPQFSFTMNIFFKILVAFIISIVAFDFKNMYIYGKSLCIFLFVSFAYIGVITSFQYLPFAKNALFVQNGEIYYNLPIPYLLIMILLLCFAQNAVARFYKRRTAKNEIMTCEIRVGGQSASVDCFCDSGNFLRDSLSGLPVVVVETRALGSILPAGAAECPGNQIFELLEEDDDFKSRLRIIPYKSAGNSGIMTAFRPDRFTLGGREEKVIVGLNPSNMDKEGRYHGIVSREL